MISKNDRDNAVEMLIHVAVLIQFFLTVTDAVNAGCECIIFSSTFGKEFGMFSSPDYPKAYKSNINCLLYTFIASRDEIIEIAFQDFDIQKSHLDCVKGDFLKIFLHLERAEVNEYTPWSLLVCGGMADVPHVLYSSGPSLVLEFHTDKRPSNSSGFLGHFRFVDRRLFQTDGQKLLGTKCDYQFVSSNYSLIHGKFYSPRYPSNYPKNVKCSYKFRARQKERIRIVFEEVALQKGDLSCLNRADLIKIYNGRNSQAPVIRSLCNEIYEVEILSTGPDIYIEFVANSDWPGQGFKANYQFQPLDVLNGHSYDNEGLDSLNSKSLNDNGPSVSATTSGCDVLFSSDVSKSGTFASPQYPNPYPPRSHCRYDFQGRGRERVQIAFTDFNLYHSTKDSKECDSLDSVNAYVHIEGRLEKIDSFCGSSIPKSVMSNGPRLMLEFRGIYSSRKVRGFRASYSFVEMYRAHAGRSYQKLRGEHFEKIKPNLSPESLKRPKAVNNLNLGVKFEVSQISQEKKFSGKLERWSGCDRWKSWANRFKSFEYFGITGGQQLPEYPCAFVFSSNESRNGTFVSPNFPGFYPRDTECHFFFHGNQREKVNLHFTYFDVEGVLPCEAISASDYIEFSNYMARDRKYSRYCGQLKPFYVQSDRKFFRVTFRSNDRLDGTGFQAFYQFLGEVESTQPKPVLRSSSAESVLNLYLTFSLLVVFLVVRNQFLWIC